MSLTQVPPVPIPARGATVVRVHGEHDMSTEVSLAKELAGAIASNDADVTLDLEDVTFMGASTVNVIVLAHDFLEAHQRHLTLRSPSTCARRVLHVCNLDELLEPQH